MRTSMSRAGRPAYYTVKKAAWILGKEPSTIARAVRVGTLPSVRHQGRCVIPTSALTRLLGAPISTRDSAARPERSPVVAHDHA
jgi:hypothetical protein